MKTLSLLVSAMVFMISGYFFISDFRYSGEMNHIIYMSLLIVLMLICVIGIVINMPLITKEKHRMKILVHNRFSRRSVRNKKFEIGLETS
ncbi:MAG TPA: hypothetical protein VGB50_08980 [Flavobacterium sp.]|jgi:membrane protein DedA with SNARE-associated domain